MPRYFQIGEDLGVAINMNIINRNEIQSQLTIEQSVKKDVRSIYLDQSLTLFMTHIL